MKKKRVIFAYASKNFPVCSCKQWIGGQIAPQALYTIIYIGAKFRSVEFPKTRFRSTIVIHIYWKANAKFKFDHIFINLSVSIFTFFIAPQNRYEMRFLKAVPYLLNILMFQLSSICLQLMSNYQRKKKGTFGRLY